MSATAICPRVLELLRFTESHNRHNEALARATGEHFNIFRVLRIGEREVTTHSPILAELLNRKGHHGQGAAFLRLFLARLEIRGFDENTATVKTEYYIGPVTENSGGRIDILVRDGKGETILIENKIYASDQQNQMKRYRGFDENAHLFYLTVRGDDPSNLSKEELDRIKCKCISYDKHILPWLKECRKDAACLPNVRETITQYIHLIEELANQSTTILMNKELIEEIIKSPESLHAFYTLRNAEVAVQDELIALVDTKLDDLAKAMDLERQGSLRELHEIWFTTRGLIRHNLKMGFAFERRNSYRDFWFGFVQIDLQQTCPIEAQLLSALEKQGFTPDKPTKYSPASAYLEEPYRNWTSEAFEKMKSPEFAEDLKAKLEILAKIARQLCPDEVISK
jgi:hypothetical protein